MKNILLLLAACAILFFSCTKNDNATAGIVLRSSANPLDSLTINTSTYTILYLSGIYTYAPNGSPTASILNFNITYNGTNVAGATLTQSTYTSLQINTPNAVFQNTLYVGK